MSATVSFHPLAAALALTAFGFAPAATIADEITVFAAASLANALADIEDSFSAATGHRVITSLASSSALARQIEQGAPADIFISASTDWMDTLDEAGLVKEGTRLDLLENSIVLIAHGNAAEPVKIDTDLDLAGLLGDGYLAMGMVDAVPAGIYGKAALEGLGLWDEVANQVAQTDNVRAALALVATGEAPYGIVYSTDAVADDRVGVAGTFPADTHPPIIYPAAMVAGSDRPGATVFLDYLQGPEARRAFERQGFVVLSPR